MLVTTAAVAEGTAVVVVTLCRPRRDDAAPAAQAPVHTAMTMMVTQIPMQQSGTITAMTIPTITAVVKIEVSEARKTEIIIINIVSDERQQEREVNYEIHYHLPKIPILEQDTATSSEWKQLLFPNPLCEQEDSMSSDEVQSTLSSQMVPEPWLYL